MVRLVFRPYTQLRRSICTSESLRTSTRVSSGFVLLRHSSPSFGSQRVRSCSTSPTGRTRSAGGAPAASGRRDPTSGGPGRPSPSLRPGASADPATRARVRLLGPCFKTGRVGDRPSSPTSGAHSGAQPTAGRADTGGRHWEQSRPIPPRTLGRRPRPSPGRGSGRVQRSSVRRCAPVRRPSVSSGRPAGGLIPATFLPSSLWPPSNRSRALRPGEVRPAPAGDATRAVLADPATAGSDRQAPS